MSQESLPFGKALRAKRLEKKYGLRKFAELVGVSPTYLSQVEQCNVPAPTADRVKRIAELLNENPEAWLALAGKLPDELLEIISERPIELAELLRAVRRLTTEQLRVVLEEVDRLKAAN